MSCSCQPRHSMQYHILCINVQQHIGYNTDNKVLTHTPLCKHANMTAAKMAVSYFFFMCIFFKFQVQYFIIQLQL